MANLTRDNLRDELKKRGWSRFLDADLERYLDWSLQAIYRKGKFPRSKTDIATIVGTILDRIPFASIAATTEAVRQIMAVYVRQDTAQPQKVEPATDEEFSSGIWPNTVASSPNLAAIPSRYYVYDGELILYPKPQVAIDVIVHHITRGDTFANGAATSGLPERFDKSIIDMAEGFCAERARDYERAAIAFGSAERALAEELHVEATQMAERQERVLPYRG